MILGIVNFSVIGLKIKSLKKISYSNSDLKQNYFNDFDAKCKSRILRF